jgi:hypothetical protein
MSGSASLHKPTGRVDLIGAVDGEVQAVEALEGLEAEAQLPGRLLGLG